MSVLLDDLCDEPCRARSTTSVHETACGSRQTLAQSVVLQQPYDLFGSALDELPAITAGGAQCCSGTNETGDRTTLALDDGDGDGGNAQRAGFVQRDASTNDGHMSLTKLLP
jgi:hypothetical protein